MPDGASDQDPLGVRDDARQGDPGTDGDGVDQALRLQPARVSVSNDDEGCLRPKPVRVEAPQQLAYLEALALRVAHPGLPASQVCRPCLLGERRPLAALDQGQAAAGAHGEAGPLAPEARVGANTVLAKGGRVSALSVIVGVGFGGRPFVLDDL